MTAASTLAAHMTEGQLLDAVIGFAHHRGWIVDHPRPARTKDGWRTAIKGDPGRPDLLMVHPRKGRVVTAELKSETGRLSRSQRAWDEALRFAAQRSAIGSSGSGPVFSHHIWRPTDWLNGSIREVLS